MNTFRMSCAAATCLLAAFLCISPPPACGQTSKSRSPWRSDLLPPAVQSPPQATLAAESEPVTADHVARLRERLRANAGLSGTRRRSYEEHLAQAERCLQLAANYRQQLADLRTRVQQVAWLEQQARERLNEALPSTAVAPDGRPPDDMRRGLQYADSRWREARRLLLQAEANVATETHRRELADVRRRAKQELDQSESWLSNNRRALNGSAEYEAAENRARRDALLARIRLLDERINTLQELEGLHQLEFAIAQRDEQWWTDHLQDWRRLAGGTTAPRRGFAQVAAATTGTNSQTRLAARQSTGRIPAGLEPLAERNLELQQSREDLAATARKATLDLRDLSAELQDQQDDLREVREKVEAGRTAGVALLLRDRRDRLADVRPHEQRISYCDAEMQRIQAVLQQLRDERNPLSNMDAAVAQTESQLRANGELLSHEERSFSIRSLLLDRRDLLDAAIQEYSEYHDTLSDLEWNSRELLSHSQAYSQFIENHKLWLRSEMAFGRTHLERSVRGLAAFGDSQEWGAALATALRNAAAAPGPTAFLLLACFGLLATRASAKERLKRLGEQAQAVEHVSFTPTVSAMALTVVLAVLWPLLTWALGWWMTLDATAADLTLAIGHGLRSTAVVFLVGELLRHACRPGGLLAKHFEWSPANLREVYQSVVWLMLLGLPLVLLVIVVQTHQVGAWRDSLGRLAYVIGLGVLSVVMHQLMHPKRGPLQVALADGQFVWLKKLGRVWYGVAVGAPIALAALALLGYTDTAQQLMRRLLYSFTLVSGVFLTYALLARAAKLAFIHLRQRPAQPQRSESGWAEQDARSRSLALESAEGQVRQLLHGLVWLVLLLAGSAIWAGVFPAMHWLDASGPNQIAAYLSGAEAGPVQLSWMDVLMAVFAGVVVSIAVKTLPGLLELAILQHLPLDEAARSAVVNISRYLMVAFGVVVIGGMLGASWSGVQWIVVALTIGVGFGLSDMVANIFSGLVLLIERPVRTGDFVTIGAISGRVSKVLMRATILTDTDNREVVIPNRRLLAEDVVNWTYNDTVTRVVASVRLDFDADVGAVQRMLHRIAERHEHVLEKPRPAVLLTRFGDDGIHVELRAYVAHPDRVESTNHDLHVAIQGTMTEHAIPFARARHEVQVRGRVAERLDWNDDDDDFDSHAA